MKKVIIFNSPPRTGKGVAATASVNYLRSLCIKAQEKEFKKPLIELTSRFLGISVEDFMCGYDALTEDFCSHTNNVEDSKFKWYKDVPIYKVCGKLLSKRQALIHVSENVIKPVFGKGIFGNLFLQTLEDGYNIVSDGGFKEELSTIIDCLGVNNVKVVRIHMDGVTFDGDSRSYIQDDWFDNLEIVDVVNTIGKQAEFEDKVCGVLGVIR